MTNVSLFLAAAAIVNAVVCLYSLRRGSWQASAATGLAFVTCTFMVLAR
jgi:hypothetical protein